MTRLQRKRRNSFDMCLIDKIRNEFSCDITTACNILRIPRSRYYQYKHKTKNKTLNQIL